MKPLHAAVWAVAMTAVHTFLWFTWLGAMILWVPERARVFNSYSVRLPWLSEQVIAVSQWTVDYWWVAAPVVLVLAAADALLIFFLYRGERHRVLAWFWSGLMAVGPLIAWFLLLIGLYLPLLKVEEGVSR